MSAIKDGGPAFPFVSHGGIHEHQCCDPGMTLRDYFAAKAMQGFCANPSEQAGPDRFAEWAYAQSDAMLAAREVQP